MRVDEHTILLDDSPVFLRRASTDAPPTLYLHSVPTSSADWMALLERNGGIAPDLPGFGRSGKGGHLDYSLSGQVDFVTRLLDHLELPCVKLVGHGWGAAAGLLLAQRHPERVSRIALIDPVLLQAGFQWPRLARIWRTPILGELAMGASNRRVLARTLRRADPWSKEEVALVWEQFDQGTQRAILRLHRSISEESLALTSRSPETLKQPMLMLWGQRDPWLASELGEAYAARSPHATLQIVPGAGHWPWRADPSLIETIVNFLS